MQSFFSMTAEKNPRNGKVILRGKLGPLRIVAYMRNDKEWDFYIEEPREGE